MIIEKALKEDHQILSTITFNGKSFWGYDNEHLEKWKNDLTITPKYIEENETYILKINDKIIGYYSILELENKILKLDNIFLSPEYIGKGFGKTLMNHCVERAKDLNIEKIILDSEPNAEKFYAKYGFKTYNNLESSIKNRFLPQMELIIKK